MFIIAIVNIANVHNSKSPIIIPIESAIKSRTLISLSLIILSIIISFDNATKETTIIEIIILETAEISKVRIVHI